MIIKFLHEIFARRGGEYGLSYKFIVYLLIVTLSFNLNSFGQEHDSIKLQNSKFFPIALKTNLLFDAVSILNIEAEVPIARKWSLAGEWIFPWWLPQNNKWCLEILSGNLEGRYWFGNRDKMLKGAFVGIYGGGGLYDLQNDLKGYQGEFYISAGISGGYSFNIGKHFNLELSLGIGYLVSEYRRYDMKEDYTILAYRYDGRQTWIGPTKAKVSLVWLISQGKYNKRRLR